MGIILYGMPVYTVCDNDPCAQLLQLCSDVANSVYFLSQ